MFSTIENLLSKHPLTTTAITHFMTAIVGFLAAYSTRIKTDGVAADFVNHTFFSVRKKWQIRAVHEYIKDDHEISGYKHLGQNSRPDQWGKLITIKRHLIFWHKVILNDLNKSIVVVISRNGNEKDKCIKFNH